MMMFKMFVLISALMSFSQIALAQDSYQTEGSTQCVTATAASPNGSCADGLTPPAHNTGPTLLGDNTNPKSTATPSGGSKQESPTGTPKGSTKTGTQ